MCSSDLATGPAADDEDLDLDVVGRPERVGRERHRTTARPPSGFVSGQRSHTYA